MIVINQLHPGRLGNRVLHYNKSVKFDIEEIELENKILPKSIRNNCF